MTEARRLTIWSTNAWVGMNPDLTAETRAKIFHIALTEVLPDVTEAEIGYALGMLAR